MKRRLVCALERVGLWAVGWAWALADRWHVPVSADDEGDRDDLARWYAGQHTGGQPRGEA